MVRAERQQNTAGAVGAGVCGGWCANHPGGRRDVRAAARRAHQGQRGFSGCGAFEQEVPRA